MIPASPENRRTIFGRNYRIPGVFKHHYFISQSYSQCSSAGSFSNNNNNHRNLQTAHFQNILSDGLSLTSFFSFQSGISSGSVYQGYNRQIKFFSLFHQS